MNLQKIYLPIQTPFRKARLKLLYELCEIGPATTVLDLGGSPFFWELAVKCDFKLPKITVLNLRPPHEEISSMKWIIGNGKQLPFKDLSFDLIFCNSVIEHLGDWASQVQLAAEIKRVARQYFVQTPAREFPIEQHFFAPFFHWLPPNIQSKLARNATVWGLLTRPTKQQTESMLKELRLLNRKEMAILFPDSRLITESLLVFRKSIIAIR